MPKPKSRTKKPQKRVATFGFATNRRPIQVDGALVRFSPERNYGAIHHGICSVTIPEAPRRMANSRRPLARIASGDARTIRRIDSKVHQMMPIGFQPPALSTFYRSRSNARSVVVRLHVDY